MLYLAIAPDVNGCDYIGPGGFMNMRGYPVKERSSDASYNEARKRLRADCGLFRKSRRACAAMLGLIFKHIGQNLAQAQVISDTAVGIEHWYIS